VAAHWRRAAAHARSTEEDQWPARAAGDALTTEQTLRRHEIISLSVQDSAAFAEALLNSSAPNDALLTSLRSAEEFSTGHTNTQRG
jgi:uncharacterized protein (DUF1778 family)